MEQEVRCEVILAVLQMRALTCFNGIFCRNEATTEATTVTCELDSSKVACDIKAADVWIPQNAHIELQTRSGEQN